MEVGGCPVARVDGKIRSVNLDPGAGRDGGEFTKCACADDAAGVDGGGRGDSGAEGETEDGATASKAVPLVAPYNLPSLPCTSPPYGSDPSAPSKLCRIVTAPDGVTSKIVPKPLTPSRELVP